MLKAYNTTNDSLHIMPKKFSNNFSHLLHAAIKMTLDLKK